MDVQGLDDLLAKLRDERPAVLKVIEGFQHQLEQADLAVATRQDTEALLATTEVFDRTIVNLDAQLNQARVTVLDLLEQGFPNLPEREVDGAVLDDLEQNRETIEAAEGQFKRRVVTTEGASKVGPEEPIPTP